MAKTRKYIMTFTYGLFSFITGIVFIRVLLFLVGANQESGFVIFWNKLSFNFISIFDGIYPNITLVEGKSAIELSSVIAMVFYMELAFLISRLSTSFVQATFVDILQKFVDFIFKFIEFILLSRFFFKITNASIASDFVKFIFDISSIFYDPFRDVLPTVTIPTLNIVFEISTFLALIVIFVFDFITEDLINRLFNVPKDEKKKDKESDTKTQSTTIVQPPYAQGYPQTYGQPGSQPQITINIPTPQVQTPIVDRRTVNVIQQPGQSTPAENSPTRGTNQIQGPQEA